MPTDTTILYFADPMCSWCWGFAPSLLALQEAAPGVPMRLVLGGLAPDSKAPMEDSMQAYIQQAWHQVSAQCGVRFNFDFWKNCTPRRSTYCACRAVIVARKFELEMPMFQAIQRAYYLEAGNPSDLEVLADVALKLGIPQQDFLAAMASEQTQQALEADFQLRRDLNVDSFPSVGVRHQGKAQLLHNGCCGPDEIQKLWRLWDRHT